jgi:hypothetical protein
MRFYTIQKAPVLKQVAKNPRKRRAHVMAQKKYATIEEVAAAMGVEINEQTKPFLSSFVLKAAAETAGAKKKELFDEAELYGVVIADKDKETVDSLKIRIVGHLYSEGRAEELAEFLEKNKLAVNEEGKIYRVKTAVKPIEERNAGGKEGTIGNLSIKILQAEEFADKSVAELVDLFPAFCEEAGYSEQGAKGTTVASLQWYVNYCRKHFIEIVERKRAAKAGKAEGGKQLGAELTLEKALAPKGFAKKKADAAPADSSLDLDAA